jgi:hypothetical protein
METDATGKVQSKTHANARMPVPKMVKNGFNSASYFGKELLAIEGMDTLGT